MHIGRLRVLSQKEVDHHETAKQPQLEKPILERASFRPFARRVPEDLCCCRPVSIEAELVEKFGVSRSPVREALLALEKEGTVIMSPYKGAIVKPLSVAEVLDIAELRLALMSLALKPAHRHLAPADFDQAYELATRATHANSAKEHFECNRRFWAIIFGKTQRPILCEVFCATGGSKHSV